jgi:excisionase family DNA binding protein
MTQKAPVDNSVLTVPEAAEVLRVSERTVRLWIHEGRGGVKLKATRPGVTGNMRIERAAIQEFMEINDDMDDDRRLARNKVKN